MPGAFVTQAPSDDTPAALLTPESFVGTVWRRTRYVIAVLISALLFCSLGWKFASPPANWGGVSLLVWQGQSYFAVIVLAVILLAATAICALIVHPDNPHMGLFCALLGMSALSIRGGSAHMLLVFAQQDHSLRELAAGHALPNPFAGVATAMALECIMWGCVALLADSFARFFHDRLLANTHWIHRADPELSQKVMARSRLGYAVGLSHTISSSIHTDRIKGPLRIPLAMAWSGGIAFLLLYAFMQSQLKGQVLMACFAAFLCSTVCAYMAFPTAPFWAILMAVPITGAVGYFLARDGAAPFPGHAPFFPMRALPIDYLTAGGAGAILGYYWGFAWAVGSVEE
jgi:hypothetical protein